MKSDLLNNDFYNEYFELFDKIPFEEILCPLILKYIPKADCEILEIGSGAGALALWMTNQGYKVTCIGPAEKPAEKARLKGLSVNITRFQDYPIEQKFDGVLAISSLIHISRLEIPLQIRRISQLIKSGAIFIASFIEGVSEGLEDPTGKGKDRFFSKFTRKELEELLSHYFSLLEEQRIDVKKMNQSFYMLVLKAF